jgi:HlyD family secretion protein
VKPEEVEGVFVVNGGRVRFTPIEIGIAGEQYFEVLSGLNEGDEVLTGPFDAVRDLLDGDRIRNREEPVAQ